MFGLFAKKDYTKECNKKNSLIGYIASGIEGYDNVSVMVEPKDELVFNVVQLIGFKREVYQIKSIPYSEVKEVVTVIKKEIVNFDNMIIGNVKSQAFQKSGVSGVRYVNLVMNDGSIISIKQAMRYKEFIKRFNFVKGGVL